MADTFIKVNDGDKVRYDHKVAAGSEGLYVEDVKVVSTQQTTVEDTAVTATLTGVDTSTDMTAAQAATIVTDLTDLSTQLNLVIAALLAHGLIAAQA